MYQSIELKRGRDLNHHPSPLSLCLLFSVFWPLKVAWITLSREMSSMSRFVLEKLKLSFELILFHPSFHSLLNEWMKGSMNGFVRWTEHKLITFSSSSSRIRSQILHLFQYFQLRWWTEYVSSFSLYFWWCSNSDPIFADQRTSRKEYSSYHIFYQMES